MSLPRAKLFGVSYRTDTFNTQSPTAVICDNAALYGATPEPGEHDPRGHCQVNRFEGLLSGRPLDVLQFSKSSKRATRWVDQASSHATTSKPLPHRAAGNSRKPCLAFTPEIAGS